MSDHDQLLVVIDPVARRLDGESVRIAKDVLCAGSEAKICLPAGNEEFARALARRGSRRLVVVGDDRALMRAVGLLHRERGISGGTRENALSLVPVGAVPALELARSLGVPTGAVAAARAVLDGVVRRLDLLVDDSGGVVLGDLRIPAIPGTVGASSEAASPSVWSACRSLVRTLVRPAPPTAPAPAQRLRVEADGVVVSDLDRPVAGISVRSYGGRAEVVVRTAAGERLTAGATAAVTVSGADFRYRADTVVGGPVRTRTWTVRAGVWGLTLPS
ncbi:diacylglycerol kinase [Streptomyces sp. NBC_01465]|uniref:diacylglycerol kinase n=1 Tax=Streptomyces sp. NBC_01465 TaxID=2903878 RepID=UPI002E353FE5|nr:diacylglycerol kinase [Streptomyces sp. NBC_01465]